MRKLSVRQRFFLKITVLIVGAGGFTSAVNLPEVFSQQNVTPSAQQAVFPQQRDAEDQGVAIASLSPRTQTLHPVELPHLSPSPDMSPQVETDTVYVPDPEAYGYTRTECGTPVLNRIPYVNRLFLNTAIRRDIPWLYNSSNETYALAASGRFLLQVHEDGKVDFWDLSGRSWHRPGLVDACTDPEIHVDLPDVKNIWCVMPDFFGPWIQSVPGDEVFWHGTERTATLRSVRDGTVLRTMITGPGRRFLAASALSPDGTLLVVQEGDEPEIPQKIGAPEEMAPHSDTFRPVRPTLVFFDTASGGRLREIPLPDGCILSMLRFSPDGKTLLAASGNTGTTYRFETATGRLAGKFEMPGRVGVQAVDFTTDGTKILTAVSFFDEEYDVREHTLSVGNGESQQVVRQWSKKITLPLYRTVIHVWDGRTFEMLHQIVEPDFVVNRAAFSRDGNRILLHGFEIKHVESRSFLGLKKDYGFSEKYDMLITWDLAPTLPERALDDSTSGTTVSGETPLRRVVEGTCIAPGEFVFDADRQRLLDRASVSSPLSGAHLGPPIRITMDLDQ